MSSGVPQGSVLSPLLFVLCINDLPDRINNKIKLIADDSNILSVIKDWDDAIRLLDDLSSICQWSEDWMIQLNVDKCKVMHFGWTHYKFSYFMRDSAIKNSNIERTDRKNDWGVYFTSDINCKEHIREVTVRAHKILGLLKKACVCRDSVLWKNLYTSLVRPHLEYAVQVWSPTREMDIGIIEKVQARATKITTSMRNIWYEARLNNVVLIG